MRLLGEEWSKKEHSWKGKEKKKSGMEGLDVTHTEDGVLVLPPSQSRRSLTWGDCGERGRAVSTW